MIAYAGRQFDRAASVVVVPGAQAVLGTPQAPVTINPLASSPSAVRPVDLRVTFSVTKSIGPDPSRAVVMIENLGPIEQSALSTMAQRPELVQPTGATVDARVWPGAVATLLAGYVGQGGPSVLCSGHLASAESRHQRSSWATTLEIGESEVELAAAECRRTFMPGTPATAVLAYAFGVMGAALSPVALPEALTGYALSRGWVATGKARDVVEALLAGVSIAYQRLPAPTIGAEPLTSPLTWWIEDRVAYVLHRRAALPGVPILVSPAADVGVRLLEQPEQITAGRVRVRTLLAPVFRLGRLVQVAAPSLAGLYRIDEIEHAGDNYGGGDSTTTLGLTPTSPTAQLYGTLPFAFGK